MAIRISSLCSCIVCAMVAAVRIPAAAADGAGTQPDNTYLSYNVPPDAMVKQWRVNLSLTIKEYRDKAGNLVGREKFYNGEKWQRELYKDGKPRGVWQTWHANGQMESSTPYLDGLMHGFVDHWDDQGQLVGHDWTDDGTGTIHVYDKNGCLGHLTQYREGRLDGYALDFGRHGNLTGYAKYVAGKCSGDSFHFFEDGSVDGYVASNDGDVDDNGIAIHYFPKDPKQNTYDSKSLKYSLRYILNGVEVPAAKYEQAAAMDATLPKFEKDPMAYRNRVPESVKKLMAFYKSLPPVKIPLEATATQPATQPATAPAPP